MGDVCNVLLAQVHEVALGAAALGGVLAGLNREPLQTGLELEGQLELVVAAVAVLTFVEQVEDQLDRRVEEESAGEGAEVAPQWLTLDATLLVLGDDDHLRRRRRGRALASGPVGNEVTEDALGDLGVLARRVRF